MADNMTMAFVAPESAAIVIREALAHMASGPPDNGVSHRRALDALKALVAEVVALRERATAAEAELARALDAFNASCAETNRFERLLEETRTRAALTGSDTP